MANSPFRSAVFDIYQKYVFVMGKSVELEYAEIVNEDKDAWTQYMKRGQLKAALENCSMTDKQFVAGIYADQLFLRKKYGEAAKYYAQSSKSFEEVSLRFIQENLYGCLIEYLECILEKVITSNEDEEQTQPQRILLCTWIVELKINELNQIQASQDNEKLSEEERDNLVK